MAYLDKLKQLRTEKGESQRSMAVLMDVSEATYQNYEYGKTSIPVDKLIEVGLKFQVQPKWFFQEDAEILVEDVRDAVALVEKALINKDLDIDKKSRAIALTSRVLARERELGRQGDWEQRLKNYVVETISLLR